MSEASSSCTLCGRKVSYEHKCVSCKTTMCSHALAEEAGCGKLVGETDLMCANCLAPVDPADDGRGGGEDAVASSGNEEAAASSGAADGDGTAAAAGAQGSLPTQPEQVSRRQICRRAATKFEFAAANSKF